MDKLLDAVTAVAMFGMIFFGVLLVRGDPSNAGIVLGVVGAVSFIVGSLYGRRHR